MKILIRGAGDIATGIALRLYRAGMQVVMTDLPAPTAIRRTVCFSQAIILGEMTVEDVTARRAETPDQAEALLAQGLIPVLADPDCGPTPWWTPFWPSATWARKWTMRPLSWASARASRRGRTAMPWWRPCGATPWAG